MISIKISASYPKIVGKFCLFFSKSECNKFSSLRVYHAPRKFLCFPYVCCSSSLHGHTKRIFLPANFSQCLLTTDRLSPEISQSLRQILLLSQQSLCVRSLSCDWHFWLQGHSYEMYKLGMTMFRYLGDTSPFFIQ
jgi:hypothetical protein